MQSFRIVLLVSLLCTLVFGTSAENATPSQGAVVVSLSGTIETAAPKSQVWTAAKLNQHIQVGYRVRAGKKSRAAVRLSNGNIIRIAAETSFTIPDLKRPTE